MLLLLHCIGINQITAINECTCWPVSSGSGPQPELKIHNRIFIGEESANLWIAAGPRPTDRILALVLRQVLKNTVGFKDAQLLNASYTYHEWLKQMSCNAVETNCSNRPMLHVGLIETGNQTSTFNGFVHSIGELGPRVRRGWFIPSRTVKEAEFGQGPDHWQYFSRQNLAKNFEFNETQLNVYTAMPDGSGKRWCSRLGGFDECDDTGQFVPDRCRNQTCATLLTAFPHENYHDLLMQIKKLKLFVKVAWVGKRLDNLISFLSQNNSRIVFFDYSISPLTFDKEEMTEVLFPSCDTSGQPDGCIYHSARMLKLVWQNIKQGAKQAYRLMENVRLTAGDYRSLMSAYRKSLSDDDDGLLDVACDLCKYKLNIGKWMENVKVYPEIPVLTVVQADRNSVEHATLLAMDKINEANIIPGYIMNQTIIHGNCNGDTVVSSYIESITTNHEQIIAVVGSECNRSLENLVGLANYYAHTVISYNTESATTNDQSGHNYFFRIAPDPSILYGAYIAFMKSQYWGIFAHFFDNAASSWNTHLRAMADIRQLKMEASVKLSSKENPRDDLQIVIEKGYRILIGDFQVSVGLRTMCMAYELGMTWRNKYAWLLPPWLPRNWFNVSLEALPENCTVEKLDDAINYSFAYQFKELEGDDFKTEVGFANVSDFKQKYLEKFSLLPYIGYAYDAIWALAKGLRELQELNQATISLLQERNQTHVKKLINSIRNNPFNGVSGPVHFVNNTRKISQIDIYQYVDGVYNCIDSFFHTRSDSLGEQFGLISQIDPEKLPKNVKKCEKQNRIVYRYGPITDGSPRTYPSNCSSPLFTLISGLLGHRVGCDVAMVIFIVAVMLTSVVVLSLAAGGLLHRYYRQKLKRFEQQQISPFSGLSEYELPEDSVRIYRSLGEGAFGKVYLGEYLKEENCVFPVAVKAAKDPKNLNAKMELLSEAEVMKRFEHVNILRLIGVITQHDKCQIVTEFMMFGNLRSYLQDRRHLAIKGEIHSAHLTRMALDISRGLSYLASLNYVHGDLACRNCLVHETLTIKIADFGFCKNLVDADYYRIVRSGPMPVRWMSPELLSTGVYHIQSDIWSFGVVLYEIITFGAYPYNDLDDNKVQDHIRNGGMPTLPQKVSSKLEALFLRMWMFKKDDRPTALELFEILTADSDLVHPALEESPSRLDYITIGAQNRHSKSTSSPGPTRTNRLRARSPPGSSHNTVQRIRYNTTTATARINIDKAF